MAPFWTEKQIEDWLTQESRVITLPCGTCRCISANRLFWENYDWMLDVKLWGHSDAFFVDLAMRWAAESGHSFEESFVNACAAYCTMLRGVVEECRPQIEANLKQPRRRSGEA